MPIAWILINLEVGAEDDLLKELKSIKEVREAYIVFGMYDLIVKVEAKDFETLRATVFEQIRSLDRVKSTVTMTVISP